MKFIKAYGLSFVWLALFAFLIVMMTGHFRHIEEPIEPLDEEATLIRDIKKKLPADGPVAFVTNLHDDEASQGAYYQTQFILCPTTLSDDVSSSDNVLFYYSPSVKDSVMNFMYHCDTLCRKQGKEYTLMLLHKNKK